MHEGSRPSKQGKAQLPGGRIQKRTVATSANVDSASLFVLNVSPLLSELFHHAFEQSAKKKSANIITFKDRRHKTPKKLSHSYTKTI